MLVWSALMRKFVVLFFVFALTACSGTGDRKAVYEKKVEHASSLEVPPDLVMPENNKALDIPSIGASQMTYSQFSDSRSQQQTTGDVLATVTSDMRVVRDGSMQWLEIKASADVLWPQLLAYFRSEGFEIKFSDTRIGLIETEWKENRVDIPTNWLSKLLKKLYDSGLRDKYRVRVEKADEGITRIFISHQGLKEVGSGDVGDLEGIVRETYWEVRESDPELEAEMMQRFLVYRGAGEDTARAMVKATEFKERAVLKEDTGFAYLEINENFPRGWRHMGIALDRIGLLVEDRNRSAGLYYIKLTEEYWKTRESQKSPGWFGGLFSSARGSKEAAYILKLASEGETTRVTVLNRDSSNATGEGARDLLVQLQRYLR